MPNPSPVFFSKKITKSKRLSPRPPRYEFVKEIQSLGYNKVIGIDEVGRGALCGPIVVAAVEIYHPLVGVHDSKLVSVKQRILLAREIEQYSQQVSFGQASNIEIDSLGLSLALELAYQRCLDKMYFDLVLTDNYRLSNYPHIKIVKGDQFFYPVAAASIVAKVFRDRLMKIYHQFHPQYNWHYNAGYGTLEHKKTLDAIGPSSLHRASFL